jgi:hypothetical protein
MGRPYLSRFFAELEDYFTEVVKFVDSAYGHLEQPAAHT